MDSASAAGDELNAPSKPAPPQDLTSEATLLEQISDIERRIKQIETGLDKPAPIPAGIRAKVHALRKWQMQIIHKEADFHKKAHAMEVAFQDEFNQCHGAISRLVNGLEVPEPDGGAGADAADQPSGIPEFWLAVLKASLLEGFIREADEPALKSLTDIRCVLKNEPEPSFLLEFQFASDNAYFTNEVLTKEYILRCAPDESDPASFEGFVIHRSVGCEIDWKSGHNLVEKAASEPPEDDAGGSFFEFFQPEKQMREIDDPDLQYALAHNDFQQGYYIKEKIIPRAVFLFLGEYVSFHDCDNCCLWAQNDCEPMELDDEDTKQEATEPDAVEESKTNADE
ncbi:nucleosome assembly protein 1-like 1 [Anopheles ziemanni]|uniref:nucleosome assembly protein 1-like 1 n=1 Tax=Anopheles coustani TaxID=139045 RepID=UPI0026591A52|nr:nucleosome assembly protein 1-like 1 [Anopheles coustani]XP_058177346.1 nucleosome assembly protein 1-like 1 [Anopheles ziemanni]